MQRINQTKSAAEKERLLTEMQARLKGVEDELEKEKKAQLKRLEKGLKDRQRRKMQQLAQEKNEEIERLEDLRNAKEEQIAIEEMKLYSQGEELVPEHL
jgi:exonuclease VII large subunit